MENKQESKMSKKALLTMGLIGAYGCNVIINSLLSGHKSNQIDHLTRPVRTVQVEYDSLKSIDNYLNEKGLKVLDGKKSKLENLKAEISPEKERLEKEIGKNVVEGILTKPGVYLLKKAVERFGGDE